MAGRLTRRAGVRHAGTLATRRSLTPDRLPMTE